jgi:hypothetical protein
VVEAALQAQSGQAQASNSHSVAVELNKQPAGSKPAWPFRVRVLHNNNNHELLLDLVQLDMDTISLEDRTAKLEQLNFGTKPLVSTGDFFVNVWDPFAIENHFGPGGDGPKWW